MIYLDNCATTWPKPPSVVKSVYRALTDYGANPGRSGYEFSIRTAEQVYNCRTAVADFFGAEKCENVVFTLNCTHSLNLVICGILKSGDHVVCSNLEHNAVIRPLHKLAQKGVSVSVAGVDPNDEEETVKNFEKCIGKNTKLIVCTHASNVNGTALPIAKIGSMCRRRGILFAIDAAQTAGVLDINMTRDCIDFLCIAGHKGLYAPMGVGVLVINTKVIPDSLITGGTGSASVNPEQPDFLPDRFESGTVNVSGICGLHAGITYLNEIGLERVREHEYSVMQVLYDGLCCVEGINLHSARPGMGRNVPIICANFKDMASEDFASLLGQKGICVRAGLHCAPSAHREMGTLEQGVVRFCPSVFTSYQEIKVALESIKNCCQ